MLNGAGRNLLVVKDGTTVATVPITSADFRYRFDAAGPGRWRLQIMRGQLIDTVSSPIWLTPGTTGLERTHCRGGPRPRLVVHRCVLGRPPVGLRSSRASLYEGDPGRAALLAGAARVRADVPVHRHAGDGGA